jgi:hypothetical protein
MSSAVLLVLSGILIGAGLSLLLGDTLRRRIAGVHERRTPSPAPPSAAPVAQVAEEAAPLLPEGAQAPAAPRPVVAVAEEPAVRQRATREPDRLWGMLAPALDAAAAKVNALLAPQQLTLGPASAADWSYRRRGYGAYRRLLLDRDSIAWLRLEVTADGRLHANLKAHRDDRAGLNGTAEARIEGLTAERAADLLLACLRPAAGTVGAEDRRDAVRAQGWQDAEVVLGSALKATNGALAQVSARIVPLTQAPEPAHPRRMALRVEVDGNDVARMHIERLNHEMEVAVGVPEASLADLARRRRLPLEGLTIHGLAELIAGCAWPAIAHFRDGRSA